MKRDTAMATDEYVSFLVWEIMCGREGVAEIFVFFFIHHRDLRERRGFVLSEKAKMDF